MRRSQPDVSVVNVMAMATKRRMYGNCAVNMLSMRAHSRLNGILVSEDFWTTKRLMFVHSLGAHLMQLDALAKNIEESYLRDLDCLVSPKCRRLEACQ